MYKLISVTLWGKPVDLTHYNIEHLGKDFILATPKGFGSCFMRRFDASNCYTVITERVS